MKDSNSTEYFLVRLIIIIGALLIGFFGARLIGSFYYQKLLDENSALNNFQKQYQDQVNQETDAYKAAKLGMIFLKTDSTDLSLAAFRKATALDPKWRDSWVWLGYAELKLNQPKQALEDLKQAEKLDPIYPLTYELLATAYTLAGDDISAQYAIEKVEYLNKSN